MKATEFEKNPTPIGEEASHSDLPEGWFSAKFLSVIDYEGGAQPPKEKFIYEPQRGYVRLLQIRDFGDKPFPTFVPDSPKLKKVKGNELLLARYGGGSADDSLGRVCTGLSGAYNVALAKLIFPNHLVDRGFVKYYLKGPWFKEAISRNSRSCQLGFNRNDLIDLRFPLAPLVEQQRIATEVDRLFARVDASRARLAKVSQILKRFRQAVLAAACSEGESIPLSEIVRDIKYGTSQKCTPVPTGNPVLRIPNIGDGSVRLDDLKYAKLPSRELAALRLVPGDILMIRSNGSVSLVGKTALVSEREAGFAYAGYLIRLRADVDRVLPEYLNLALRTHSIREQIEIPARSTSGVHNINSTEVLSLKINLPDLDAQKATVRRVEGLFKLAGTIEERVERATKRADKLSQAILAKAFRGELVPTEAELARREGRDYESASALLARIKAECLTTTSAQRISRRNVRLAGAARRRVHNHYAHS